MVTVRVRIKRTMELCTLSFVVVAVAAAVVNVIRYTCTEYWVSWLRDGWRIELCGSTYLHTVLHIVHTEYTFFPFASYESPGYQTVYEILSKSMDKKVLNFKVICRTDAVSGIN